MKKNVFILLFTFVTITLSAQRNVDRTNFRAGLNGGMVIGDFSEDYTFGLGVDMYHHWGVSKALDIGITTGFFNAFGEEEVPSGSVSTESGFDNLQYIPVGASLRIYPGKNVGFKFGSDIGYAVGIDKGNEGALYFRPSLGMDLRDGTNEVNISYFVVNGDVQFSSVVLAYMFLF
ncbi:hypothetical protein CLV91_3317 [Maribacter vaceletii]|uniref:Outer membrane protein with beta-barrel domain n=1 Tax=Maribacter vaceletii TaxID=1206816 RepID=A0A495DS96_9FLAO|nr:hypothetical protein [Maribacter vaceletii]RKR06462.1 hypothetical protein CLV91_3317 [Maribacter vaceletii]